MTTTTPHRTARRTTRGLATAAAATALAAAAATLGLAGPATAASIGVEDPADVAHGVDLRAVQVRHNENNLKIVLSHADLRRSPSAGAGGATYIDTDRADAGPELVFVGGYFEGTDYQLVETEGFGSRFWKQPVEDGSYEMTLDYVRDRTVMRISREALGGAGKVRVAVKVAGQRTDGSEVVDWLREPRWLTRWVARG